MELKKLSAPSLRDVFVKEMERSILSGEVKIGEKLPSEREMASKMGVSRAVIISGMDELEAKGFVEVRPRSGTVVSDYRRKGSLDTIASIVEYTGGNLKSKDIISIVKIRMAVEKIMLEDLIPKITDEEISHMEELLTSLGNASKTEDIIESTFRFQHELTILCGNTMLPLLYYSFKPAITSIWAKYLKANGKHSLYENAKGLLSYIKNKDLEGALKWSSSYLTATLKEPKIVGREVL